MVTLHPLIELQAALEARRVAEERVAELRHLLITHDLPRPWVFSHEGQSDWRDHPGQRGFLTIDATRARVEAELREAVLALPWDRSDRHYVRASASCSLTGESVELLIPIEQDVPDCLRTDGHEWFTLLDDRSPEDHPGCRRLTEGCPHCDGQKTTLSGAESAVTYDAPHHYPEGSVRRRLG